MPVEESSSRLIRIKFLILVWFTGCRISGISAILILLFPTDDVVFTMELFLFTICGELLVDT